MTVKITHEQKKALYKFLARSFNLEEIHELCFELDKDPSNLPGSGQTAKARELVLYAERWERMGELFEAIHAIRPNVDLTPYGAIQTPATQARTDTTAPSTTAGAGPASQTTATAAMQYGNFDIRIGEKRADGRYPITAESTYGETGRASLQELPDSGEFEDLIIFLRDGIARPADAEELGQMLQTFLFPSPVWDLFGRSLAKVNAEGKVGLRVRVRIGAESPELSRIPWEYCRDDRSFLALNDATPLVRYIPTDRPPQAIATPEIVRILVAMATPQDYPALNVTAEESRISDALAGLINAGRIELKLLTHATPRELRSTFRRFDPHILHFIGHGQLKKDDEGALVLEDGGGQSQLVDADDMLVLLRGSSAKLVVLNACETAAQNAGEAIMGVAPRLVWAGVPAVVAMQFKVPDKMAIAFMRDLYEFMADGKPLDAAITEARIGVYFDSTDQEKAFWAIPVLFMRAPDGVIWKK